MTGFIPGGLGEVRLVGDDALAFWLREPGVGEIRPDPCASRARTRCSCARCDLG